MPVRLWNRRCGALDNGQQFVDPRRYPTAASDEQPLRGGEEIAHADTRGAVDGTGHGRRDARRIQLTDLIPTLDAGKVRRLLRCIHVAPGHLARSRAKYKLKYIP